MSLHPLPCSPEMVAVNVDVAADPLRLKATPDQAAYQLYEEAGTGEGARCIVYPTVEDRMPGCRWGHEAFPQKGECPYIMYDPPCHRPFPFSPCVQTWRSC